MLIHYEEEIRKGTEQHLRRLDRLLQRAEAAPTHGVDLYQQYADHNDAYERARSDINSAIANLGEMNDAFDGLFDESDSEDEENDDDDDDDDENAADDENGNTKRDDDEEGTKAVNGLENVLEDALETSSGDKANDNPAKNEDAQMDDVLQQDTVTNGGVDLL